MNPPRNDPRPTQVLASPVVMECLSPRLDGGRFPVKRELGDIFVVECDAFRHGHDILEAALLYRVGKGKWRREPMTPIDNDRWRGSLVLDALGTYEYNIETWTEPFASWRRDTERKAAAGQDIASDLEEGAALTARAGLEIATGELLSEETAAAMRGALRAGAARSPTLKVLVERERARVGAWYEFFPRSQGSDPTRSATLRECVSRLPEIQAMGFDVVYLPPIHPIGKTNRKGPNNSLQAGADDPGSPYAIGSEAGGHDAIEPSLGTLADFEYFVSVVHAHGMEVALDFAVNCSPDHPYVTAHPDWFYHRPDGSIRYAENPPKRYEDIYPLNFEGPAAAAIWRELRRVLAFWAARGVRIFRVDNPHTKPMPFWEWLLASLREEFPDLIFLSEAFTRPKPMKHLAKLGFSQSYTYFTWRNTKAELTEYVRELALGPCREYFRPNFFLNTPDILPQILQTGGRPAFLSRLVLAATLAPNYGMYSGYELCENRVLAPGGEEYADSEKYQFKVWDWDRPGNIKTVVATVNRLRREHVALRRLETVRFLRAENEQILLYSKHAGDDRLVIAVNLDPHATHEAAVEFPLEAFGIGDEQLFEVTDLLRGESRGKWRGRWHHLRLEAEMPAAILHLRPL